MKVIFATPAFYTRRWSPAFICHRIHPLTPQRRLVMSYLLPESKIAKSCTVDAAYLQWKATITTNSSVSSTVLMECSEIGPNSFVSSTVLGPDSHLSAGECHHSLLGPNTNSHHQSLLISVFGPWDGAMSDTAPNVRIDPYW